MEECGRAECHLYLCGFRTWDAARAKCRPYICSAADEMPRVPSALCISAAPRMGCRACRAPFVYRQRRGWDVTRAECPLYICSSTRVRCRACRMLSASMRLPAWDAALYHGHRFDAADVGKRAAAEWDKADARFFAEIVKLPSGSTGGGIADGEHGGRAVC